MILSEKHFQNHPEVGLGLIPIYHMYVQFLSMKAALIFITGHWDQNSKP